MQRATFWIIGAGLTGAALMLVLQAQERQTGAPASAQKPAATPSAASGSEKIAFTFPDEDQMRQFAQLWQQRQATLTKMAVLQDYFTQEQTALADQNKQLLSTYNLDVSKNYTLDTDRKVLVEREAPPEQPAQPGQPQNQPQPLTGSKP